jgi:hypothetical protein
MAAKSLPEDWDNDLSLRSCWILSSFSFLSMQSEVFGRVSFWDLYPNSRQVLLWV